MKLQHNNIALIEDWLESTGLTPTFTDDFIRLAYESVLEQRFAISQCESLKHRRRGFSLQYDFVRRDLLKILHKRNGYSAAGISAGYVYAIGNPAWKDFVKIGSAIDIDDRLNSYQTQSPHRDFYIIDYYFVLDRRKEETILHSMFTDRQSEWCNVSHDKIKEIYKQRKAERMIMPTEDKLWEVKDRCNSILNLKKNNWYSILRVEDDIQ